MDSRPTHNPQHVQPSSSSSPPAPSRPKLLEVDLKRRYAPHWLVQDDGTVLPNETESGVLTVLEPGIMKLHHEDAAIALGASVALPTRATFKD
jgi:hypothetical protein